MWSAPCRALGASYAKRQERCRNPEVALTGGRACRQASKGLARGPLSGMPDALSAKVFGAPFQLLLFARYIFLVPRSRSYKET
jgi:hypothetical protein